MPFVRSIGLLILLAVVTGASVSSCAYFQFPGIHRVSVQQGNIITQEMIDQLKPGMTKSQVRYVMGTPLVADSFHQNRWDYFYSITDSDGEERREEVTIYFAEDKLTRIQGDYLPSRATQQNEQSDN